MSNNEGYTAMSGGLTRTTANLGSFTISNQLGGVSKDTWIISPEPGRVLNVHKEIEKTAALPPVACCPAIRPKTCFGWDAIPNAF